MHKVKNDSTEKIYSIKKLQEKYDPEPAHSDHVTAISLQLFDGLKPLHKLEQEERILLHASATLHDIGYYVNGNYEHHKNSMKLILKHGIEGFTERQILMVANIARYHRKALPNPKHKFWAKLDNKEKEIVSKLASFVRIADGLDRSHRNIVQKVNCQISPTSVILYIEHFGELNNEIYYAQKKSDLFKEVFFREIIFLPKLLQNL